MQQSRAIFSVTYPWALFSSLTLSLLLDLPWSKGGCSTSQRYQPTIRSGFPVLNEAVHKYPDPQNCFLQNCWLAVSQGPNFWLRTRKHVGRVQAQLGWGYRPNAYTSSSISTECHRRRRQLGVHSDLVTGRLSAQAGPQGTLSLDKTATKLTLCFPALTLTLIIIIIINTVNFLCWHFLGSPVKAWVGKWRVFSKSDSGINLKNKCKRPFPHPHHQCRKCQHMWQKEKKAAMIDASLERLRKKCCVPQRKLPFYVGSQESSGQTSSASLPSAQFGTLCSVKWARWYSALVP